MRKKRGGDVGREAKGFRCVALRPLRARECVGDREDVVESSSRRVDKTSKTRRLVDWKTPSIPRMSSAAPPPPASKPPHAPHWRPC